MSLLETVRSASSTRTTEELLSYLLKERFPDTTVVTASLRSSSVVVLKMIADLEPDTPVVFCRPGPLFEESREYRDQLVALLGLTNVRTESRRNPVPGPGGFDHFERMWVEYENGPGRSFEIFHLNDVLEPYECWVSAVYHVPGAPDARHRVDVEGGLCRIDPLAGWTKEDVREFMRAYRLPYHKRAYRSRLRLPHADDPTPTQTYPF